MMNDLVWWSEDESKLKLNYDCYLSNVQWMPDMLVAPKITFWKYSNIGSSVEAITRKIFIVTRAEIIKLPYIFRKSWQTNHLTDRKPKNILTWGYIVGGLNTTKFKVQLQQFVQFPRKTVHYLLWQWKKYLEFNKGENTE